MQTYVDIKPVVTIVASMDATGGDYYSRGATVAYNAVFRGGYYSRGLLNKGASIQGNTISLVGLEFELLCYEPVALSTRPSLFHEKVCRCDCVPWLQWEI